MPRATITFVLAALALAPGCRRSASDGGAPQVARNPEGTLPLGCTVVADLVPAELGPLAPAVTGLMTSKAGGLGELPGIDLARDVRRIRFCQLPAAPGAAPATSFVLTMAGTIPANVVDVLAAAASEGVVRERIDDLNAIGRGRTWITRRDSAGGSGEIVMASDRELLHVALVGPPGNYPRDPAAALSVVMGESEVRRLVPAHKGHDHDGEGSPLEAVRQIRFELTTGARELVARFVVGDPGTAGRLLPELTPVVAELVNKMGGASTVPAEVATAVEGNDVVSRARLTPRGLEALAAQLADATSKRAPPRPARLAAASP